MLRSAVIFYHADIASIYPAEWIKQCVNSIKGQTYKQYDIIELNYGNGADQYTKGEFHKIPMKNHIEAMNYLYDMAFSAGYDVVFNTNMDDWYYPTRFERQILAIEAGAQLVSSNFRYSTGRLMHMSAFNIAEQLKKGHNVIAHPVVAMHKTFWDNDLHYNDMLGHEDLDLWQRAIAKGKNFTILTDILLNYRIHANQIGKKYK